MQTPQTSSNNEEWKKSKKEEKKNLEKDIVSTENELDNDSNRGMENETDNNRMESKRKKGNNNSGQAKTKKRKLDPLVDWGEAKLEFDGQEEIPSSWFSSSLDEGDAESSVCPAVLDWRSKPKMTTGNKLRQMELTFSRVLVTIEGNRDNVDLPDIMEDPEVVEVSKEVVSKTIEPEKAKQPYKRQTGKIRKKEGLALAAKNKKVSSWLRNETRSINEERDEKHSRRLEEETVTDMDWTDPVVEMDRQTKQAEASLKKEHFLCTAMIRKMVVKMVEETPPASAVGKIIDEVVEEATITGIVENIWKELEEDNDMLDRIVQKIEENSTKRRLVKADEERNNRLETKVRTSKEWLDRRRMDNLLESMKCMEMGSFDGEWSEHEINKY